MAEKLTISRREVLVKWRKEKWEGRSDNMITAEIIAHVWLGLQLVRLRTEEGQLMSRQ